MSTVKTVYQAEIAEVQKTARVATILHLFGLIKELHLNAPRGEAFDALSKELESVTRVLVIAHKEIELLREEITEMGKTR